MPGEPRDPLPLAAGLHSDGTIHVYVDEEDSGLSIGLDDDGTLVVRVDETKRTMRATKSVADAALATELAANKNAPMRYFEAVCEEIGGL